jgi:soluble lytic murein transglycosylase-like protein
VRERQGRHHCRRWLAALAAVIAMAGCATTGSRQSPTSAHTPESAASGIAGAPSADATNQPVPTRDQNLARFAAQVVTHAGSAGVSPQLLMAILYNESYKPHDPAAERAWQRVKPDAAFGIANMHKAAFEDTKRGRDFAGRNWQELPDDPDLAIQAAAWYLHDLGVLVPAIWSGPYTRDELLALGYNAGAGNMKAFAGGAKPGKAVQSYLDRLRANWAAAGQAVRHPN